MIKTATSLALMVMLLVIAVKPAQAAEQSLGIAGSSFCEQVKTVIIVNKCAMPPLAASVIKWIDIQPSPVFLAPGQIDQTNLEQPANVTVINNGPCPLVSVSCA